MNRRSFFGAAAVVAAAPLTLLAAKENAVAAALPAPGPPRFVIRNVFGPYGDFSLPSKATIERLRMQMARVRQTA